MSEFQAAVTRSRDAIWAKRLLQPKVAIILGSGLGPIAEEVEHSTAIPFADLPGFPSTSAAGHAGRLILGFLSGIPVVLLQGRVHRYEGWSQADVQFPAFVCQALGAHTLITTNAAGGLNGRYRQGDLMVIDSHIDLLWSTTSRPDEATIAPAQPLRRGTDPYQRALIERAQQIARAADIVLHQGCYLATLGPTYETRSEYRAFRWMGADAVGMSTVPEVLVANSLGMDVLAFSVITNVASTDVPILTSHEEVVETGNRSGPSLSHIISQILDDLSGEPD